MLDSHRNVQTITTNSRKLTEAAEKSLKQPEDCQNSQKTTETAGQSLKQFKDHQNGQKITKTARNG